MKRSVYLKMLQEEYRSLNTKKVEIQKRMDKLHEQIEKLKDGEQLKESANG